MISSLITYIKMNNWRRASELIFLAKLQVIKAIVSDISAIPVATEYIDVFSEKLSILLLWRKIEFVVEIQLEIASIVKITYKMTTKELYELKS